MEAIQSISVSSLHKFISTNKKVNLVIVSDMLQNSETLSHYKEHMNFKKFKKQDFIKVSSSLNDVLVTILYLRRDGAEKLQGRKHIVFWEQFFHDQGGILKRVVSIDG